jgi:hypothetical protein
MNFTKIFKRILTDQEGNRIIELPVDTHLDNIIPDIWSIITIYLQHSFFLGLENKKYSGY